MCWWLTPIGLWTETEGQEQPGNLGQAVDWGGGERGVQFLKLLKLRPMKHG